MIIIKINLVQRKALWALNLFPSQYMEISAVETSFMMAAPNTERLSWFIRDSGIFSSC